MAVFWREQQARLVCRKARTSKHEPWPSSPGPGGAGARLVHTPIVEWVLVTAGWVVGKNQTEKQHPEGSSPAQDGASGQPLGI